MANQCDCASEKCGSNDSNSSAAKSETLTTPSTSVQGGEKNGSDRTSLYKVIMSCMTDLNERDHFYQFPMSYSYQKILFWMCYYDNS